LAFKGVLDRRSRLGLIDAPPGEHQASLLREIGRAYERSGHRVRWAAPTGAAAEALARELRVPVLTTRSLVERATRLPLAEVFGWMHRHQSPSIWAKIQAAQTVSRPRDRLTRKDVVVVTDAQLLNTRDGQNLLALARRAGAKVILTGDKSQAPGSGGAGGAFRYLLDRRRSYQIMPERGDRAESVAANDLRRGRAEAAVKGLLAEGRVYSGDSLREAALTLFDQYRAAEGFIEPARHLIVTGKSREANRFNTWVQRERQRAGLLGLASVRVPKGPRVRAGDRVVMTRSHGALGIRAGATGTAVSVNPFLRTVTVRKDTGGEVDVPVDRFPYLALGYAAPLGRASAVRSINVYALLRGYKPGPLARDQRAWLFSRQALTAVLERAVGRVELFTERDLGALAASLRQQGHKTLAISHRAASDHDRFPTQVHHRM